jgi:hypothetical protein
MKYLFVVSFVFSGLYAVLGNIIVYFILIRRKVTLRSIWAGTPGYLYRICVKERAIVGSRLRRFAFSTNIAFLVAMILGLVLGGFQIAAR